MSGWGWSLDRRASEVMHEKLSGSGLLLRGLAAKAGVFWSEGLKVVDVDGAWFQIRGSAYWEVWGEGCSL